MLAICGGVMCCCYVMNKPQMETVSPEIELVIMTSPHSTEDPADPAEVYPVCRVLVLNEAGEARGLEQSVKWYLVCVLVLKLSSGSGSGSDVVSGEG